MAAILQLRRGSGSIDTSINDGELYLHKASGSIQFSLGDSNPILLARLDQINSGSLNLSGDVTASNAYFSGDVAISGNLFLGNAANEDTITAGGEFTSNLVPNPTNTYSIGSTTKVWKEMHATSFSGSFSGSITGINEGVSVFSASVDNRLDQLQLASASLQLFSSSQEAKDIIIRNYTSSMNTFTSSQAAKDVIISAYTSSMNTFTASVNGHISDINTYTASLKAAIDVAGGNTRILGNLIVDGTQTSLNTTETYIEDKSITLASGSTTSAIADGAGLNIAGAGVSMSWDHTNTRLHFNTNISALGSISSSTIVGLNGASVTSYSTSVDSRLSNLQSFSASVNGHIVDINAWTASNGNTSLNEYTASATIRLNNLESTSASVNGHITDINTKTGSFETKFDTIQSVTSSLNAFTASQEAKDTTLEIVTSSLNLATASFNSWTGSTFNTFSTSVDTRLDDVEYMVTVLDPGNIGDALLALNTFTASNGNASLNSYTASLKNAITINGTDVSIAGGLTVLGTTTIIDTTTLAIKDNIIELNAGGGTNGGLVVRDVTGTTISGSLLWDTINDYWIAGPLGAESKLLRAGGDGVISSSAQISLIFEEKASASHTLVSGSSQITFSGISSLPTLVSGSSQVNFTQLSGISNGIVSSSAQISPLLPSGVVSGSSQIDATSTTNWATGIKTQLNSNAVVSGSSQINLGSAAGNITLATQTTGDYVASLVQGTGVTITNNSGESAFPTIAIGQAVGTSSDVQFGSIGVGTTASGTSGEIRATGDITAYYSSDIRLKENIIPIPNALEKVNQISGNTYDWKEGYDEVHSHKGNDVGVIAQEIEAILPQIVTNRDTGFKAVQYEKIIPLLIEAIKELSAKVDRLENK